MSTYALSKAHIDYLVQAARIAAQPSLGMVPFGERTLDLHDPRDAAALGRALWHENMRSVLYSYPDDTIEARGLLWEQIYCYHPEAPRIPFSAVAALKALDCYEYQSCEHPGWQQSAVHACCQTLRRRLIACLPGYAAAPWEVTAEQDVAAA